MSILVPHGSGKDTLVWAPNKLLFISLKHMPSFILSPTLIFILNYLTTFGNCPFHLMSVTFGGSLYGNDYQ